jgi:hypothetical protein
MQVRVAGTATRVEGLQGGNELIVLSESRPDFFLRCRVANPVEEMPYRIGYLSGVYFGLSVVVHVPAILGGLGNLD